MPVTRPDLSSERGVAMLVVLMALIAGSLVSAVALSAAGADLPFARESQDRKQAYAAAEAGLEYYLFQLSQDNDFWTRCTNVPEPNETERSPVNAAWDGRGADPRAFRKVPGTTSEYAIELLPARGSAQCVPGSADATFLDRSTGTFRIRSTGRVNGVTRSLVTTMRRSSFLDYIYFTDLETADPATYGNADARNWAANACVQPRAGRPDGCEEIQFSGTDAIRGPFHTNDDILTCGATTFGRDPGHEEWQRPEGSQPDKIEVSGPAGWTNARNCSGQPNLKGTLVNPVNTLTMPASNASLESVALPQYRYTGKTTIRLNGTTMNVTNSAGVTTSGVPLPPNGVIYVRNGACTGTVTPLFAAYNEGVGCANLYLSGTYARSLTIASANDIIIAPPSGSDNGDVRMAAGSDAVLGLIANNFVRVQHRVRDHSDASSCRNSTPVMQNVRIEAAILSLAHSFIVDNYACGDRMGTLTVKGAIAQRFRGPVGTTRPTGYTKNYMYDDRLKYRSPPFFLDPISAAWKVARANEQVPATFERPS
jgi:hypothetical protein